MGWLRCQKLLLCCLNFDFKIWFGPVYRDLRETGPRPRLVEGWILPSSTDNSSSQDHTQPNDQTALSHVTPGFNQLQNQQVKKV